MKSSAAISALYVVTISLAGLTSSHLSQPDTNNTSTLPMLNATVQVAASPGDAFSSSLSGKTALCGSGGGARAMGLFAGALRGLNAAGLASDFDVISTVSGGRCVTGLSDELYDCRRTETYLYCVSPRVLPLFLPLSSTAAGLHRSTCFKTSTRLRSCSASLCRQASCRLMSWQRTTV